ncbi:MAG: hypothetical protein MUE35_04500 [Hydrogenophaga sp.]|nr:hypothetical protein [Hydrogenophaga sp.]
MSKFRFTLATLSAALLALGAQAQPAATKDVVVEPVPAATALSRWVDTVVIAITPPAPGTAIVTVAPPAAPALGGTVGGGSYEAWPVIVGVPELPLVGATGAGSEWAERLNYQGMHMRLLVLDADGRTHRWRSVNQPPRPGERFRIRLTATFPAVSEVGLVVGGTFASSRAGQLYPQPGMSVQLNAGETVDLPLERDRYFVIGNPAERLVLSVRHPRATDAARSTQPAYRQDMGSGSNYLQLVPQGRYPAFEQLIAASAR